MSTSYKIRTGYDMGGLSRLAALFDIGELMVEIGSFAGESTEIWLKSGLFVHAIDPWSKSYEKEFYLHNGYSGPPAFSMLDIEKEFDKLLSQYPHHLTKKKGKDIDFYKDYKDESLIAVYIDSLKADTWETIIRWLPKVKKGGWLSGHDYNTDKVLGFNEVNEAVHKLGIPLIFSDSSWAIQKA